MLQYNAECRGLLSCPPAQGRAPRGAVAAEGVEVDRACDAVDAAAVGMLPQQPVGAADGRVGEGTHPQAGVVEMSADEASVAALVGVDYDMVACRAQIVHHGMQLQDDLAGDAAGMVAPLLDVYGQGHVGRAVPERPQQVGSLTPSFAVEAEEMVGAYLQAGATCAVEIVFKVGVAESRAFRCFDVDETDAVGGHTAEVDEAVVGADVDACYGIALAVGVDMVGPRFQHACRPCGEHGNAGDGDYGYRYDARTACGTRLAVHPLRPSRRPRASAMRRMASRRLSSEVA